MDKLPRLTGKEVARVVEKFGFVHSHTVGSHRIYKHPDGRKTSIPCHAGEQIGPGLLLKIIKKDIGTTREGFLKKI